MRVTGRYLPPIDKILRLRCTLHAADHTVVGVSTAGVYLGTASGCDYELAVVHEPPGQDEPQPSYFELVASLAPTAEPSARIPGAFTPGRSSDGTEYRVAGLMHPGQHRIDIPPIALRGA